MSNFALLLAVALCSTTLFAPENGDALPIEISAHPTQINQPAPAYQFFTSVDESCMSACLAERLAPPSRSSDQDEARAPQRQVSSSAAAGAGAELQPDEECEDRCRQFWIINDPGKKREKKPKFAKISEEK